MLIELWQYKDNSGFYLCRYYGHQSRQFIQSFRTKRSAVRFATRITQSSEPFIDMGNEAYR